MYREDWLLRQIKEMINIIIFLIIGKKVDLQEYISSYSVEADELNKKLHSLIDKGEISKAEKEIFENISIYNNLYGIVALGFYQKLNMLSDEELENLDYSREKLYDGLVKIETIYGYNIFQ